MESCVFATYNFDSIILTWVDFPVNRRSVPSWDKNMTLIERMLWEDISKDFLSKKGKDIPVTYIQELCSKSFQEAAEYTIRLFMLSETSQEVISEWNRLALIEYKHNIKLKKYCLPYLQYLKEEGKKLAIATSLPRILCDSCLISNGIYDMFDVIRSTDEIGRGKNFPDIFEKISDELKVKWMDMKEILLLNQYGYLHPLLDYVDVNFFKEEIK